MIVPVLTPCRESSFRSFVQNVCLHAPDGGRNFFRNIKISSADVVQAFKMLSFEVHACENLKTKMFIAKEFVVSFILIGYILNRKQIQTGQFLQTNSLFKKQLKFG